MTSRESANRKERLHRRIASCLRRADSLGPHAASVSITLNDASVILDGTVPHREMIERIVPAIRAAGVLARIENRVRHAA